MNDSSISLESLLAHSGWANALAKSLIHDPDRVDEVVQRAWFAALEQKERIQKPRPWLRAVIQNSIRQIARSERRRAQREERAASPEAMPSTCELVEHTELQVRVSKAVLALAEPNRSTLLLHYFEGFSFKQIAEQQGIPEGTVRSRHARALEQLREGFDREWGERRAWALAFLPLALPKTEIAASVAGVSTIAWIGGAIVSSKLKAALVVLLLGSGVTVWSWIPSEKEGDSKIAKEETPSTTALLVREDSSPSTTQPSEELQRVSMEKISEVALSENLEIRVSHADGSPARRVIALLSSKGKVLQTAWTKDQGEARFAPVDGEVDLMIAGATEFPYQERIPGSKGTRSVRLPEGGVVEGVVLIDGKVPKAPIQLFLLGTGPEQNPLPIEIAEALVNWGGNSSGSQLTDREGRFRFSGLAQDWNGMLLLPQEDENGKQVLDNIKVGQNLVVRLAEISAIVGRVMDQGKPAPFASIAYSIAYRMGPVFHSGGGREVAFAWEDGRFQIGLPRGTIEKISLIARSVEGTASWAVDMEHVPERGVDLGDIELSSLRNLSFVVRDQEGSPVSGAEVSTARLDNLRSEPTNVEGKGVLRGVRPETKTVRVEAFRHLPAEVNLEGLGDAPAQVTLERSTLLDLKLRDSSGKVPPDVSVQVRSEGDLFLPGGLLGYGRLSATHTLQQRISGVIHKSMSMRGPVKQTTFQHREDGRYLFPCLAPGLPFELWILDRMDKRIGEPLSLVLGKGETLVLEHEISQSFRDLFLLVRDTKGNPITGASVNLPGKHQLKTATDAKGEFRRTSLYVDEIDLLICKKGFADFERPQFRIPSDGRVVEIVLESESPLSVKVLDESGQLVPEAKLEREDRFGPQLIEAGAQFGVIHDDSFLGPSAPEQTGPGLFEWRAIPQRAVSLKLTVAGRIFRKTCQPHEKEIEFRVPTFGSLDVSVPEGLDSKAWPVIEIRPLDGLGEAITKTLLSPQSYFLDESDAQLVETGPYSIPVIFPGKYSVGLVVVEQDVSGLRRIPFGLPQNVEILPSQTMRIALTK